MKWKIILRYTLLGLFFGLLFPLVANGWLLYSLRLPLSAASIRQTQAAQPLLWMIDTAPLFLGLFAYFIGRRQGQLLALNEELARNNQERDELIGQLETLKSELEQRMATQAVKLHAAAQVAREAVAVRDRQQLPERTVKLISDQFGYYHAGIFLIDDAREYAVLQAASSQGGEQMLTNRYKLRIGSKGIVGFVAESGEPRIALDVGADPVFFDNPFLPETRSEIALPLKAGDRLIGVLDVQSTQPDAFSQEDLHILQTLADQITVAIENDRLMFESQAALKELEALYGSRILQRWEQRLESLDKVFVYDWMGVKPGSVGDVGRLENDREGYWLDAPIELRGQRLGWVRLQRSAETGPWWPHQKELVDKTIAQVALALENALLFEEAQARISRQQTLNQMTASISRTLDVESLLRTALQELGRLPGVVEASVHLGSPGSGANGPAAHPSGNGYHLQGSDNPADGQDR